MQLAATAVGTPYYLSPEICQNKKYNQKVWETVGVEGEQLGHGKGENAGEGSGGKLGTCEWVWKASVLGKSSTHTLHHAEC